MEIEKLIAELRAKIAHSDNAEINAARLSLIEALEKELGG